MAIEKPKRHKSRGIDQIPVQLIKTANMTILSEIHKIIYSISNKEELHEESIIVPIYQKCDNTNCSNCSKYFVFRRKGRVHLNRRGRQFSRLLAAEVCASALIVGSNA
jgi:hypothetical protein